MKSFERHGRPLHDQNVAVSELLLHSVVRLGDDGKASVLLSAFVSILSAVFLRLDLNKRTRGVLIL